MKTGCEIWDRGLPSLRWVLAWLAIAFISQAAILSGQAIAPAPVQPRPNILFIMVDDLRPELGCYGQALIRSPHIDALAESAIQFNRAYCMVPTCGASRASLMTGLRPHPTRFVKHGARINREAPRALSLHTCLQQAGYTTVSLGKVIHHPDDQQSGWSIPPWRPEKGVSMDDDDLTLGGGRGASNPNWAGPAFAVVGDDDGALVDVEIAARAIGHLQQLSTSDRPFFLAVGFIRPHLPFVAPRTSWDLYEALQFSLPPHLPPAGIPRQALHNFAELRNYQGIPKAGPLGEELSRQLIHGYCASVSFVDAQVGRVLDELERLQLADKTIVVLWGDHGWNLGEHGLWCKHCCFETSMRVPLIIRVPGRPTGVQVDGLVETIDLYPTLCELAGVAAPQYLHGRSFAAGLRQPETIGKSYAIGRYDLGDTIRTEHFRYTEYRDNPAGEITARMLFDHRRDPDEMDNLAERAEYQQLMALLSKQLHEVIDPLPSERLPVPSQRSRRGR